MGVFGQCVSDLPTQRPVGVELLVVEELIKLFMRGRAAAAPGKATAQPATAV